MPFTFEMPEGHPGNTIVARLSVVCPHHSDACIASYDLMEDGTEVVTTTEGFTSEFIRNGDPLPEGVPGFLNLPDGEDQNSPSHYRHRFKCLRPSCGYDAARRCDGPHGLWTLTSGYLRGMAAAGITKATITDVDKNPWRVVTS